MTGDIFYTNVDENLKTELNARGRSGFNRSNPDQSSRSLHFMLDKVANVSLVAYEGQDRKVINKSSYIGPIKPTEITNDAGVKSSETFIKTSFLPNSYLDTKSRSRDIVTDIDLKSFQIEPKEGKLSVSVSGEAEIKTKTFNNVSQRIPPVITACSMTIGDNSQGTLNKAEIQILIPNADVDLDEIEKIYFRPGRLIQLRIVHPESAVITKQRLTSENVLPSLAQLKKQNPNMQLETLNKINETHFEGVITSFEFSYEQDASVSATIFTTGISNVYTDLSMLINEQDFITGSLGFSYIDGDKNKKKVISGSADAKNKKQKQRNTFYEGLLEEHADFLGNIENKAGGPQTVGFAYGPNSNEKENSDVYMAFVDGLAQNEDEDGKDFIRYISLGYLIDYINRKIVSKNKTIANAKITCDDIICKSNYYEHITSADPRSVLLPGFSTQLYDYDNIIVFANLLTSPSAAEGLKPFYENSLGHPSRILLSLDMIKLVLLNIDPIEEVTDNKTEIQSGVQIKHFLRRISDKISISTGRAIDMKLICHPNDDSQSSLCFYDANFAGTPESQKAVKPFSVPMFANHPNGTIVREFSIKAKLPGSAKNLAFVLNDGTDVSEAKIAPFLQFMYQDNTDAATEAVKKMLKDYAEKHYAAVETLRETQIKLAENFADQERQTALNNALIEYIKYPKERMSDSVLIGSPQFPYEVSFTIDGISGFRYGDVLEFLGIPKRYRNNTVFSIKNIQHNVDTSGMWTTKITCMMRPKI